MLDPLRETGRQALLLAAVIGIVPGACVAQQSFLGVGVQEVNAALAKQFELAEVRGVAVTSVVANSAAAEAGIEEGDVVLAYNGQDVVGVEQFRRLVRETPVGRDVTLDGSRDGGVLSISVEMGSTGARSFGDPLGLGSGIGEGPGVGPGSFSIGGGVTDPPLVLPSPDVWRMPDMPQVFTTWRSGTLGIEAESLNEQLAEYFGVEEGVLVRSVEEDSAAEEAGFRAGDVILRVGGEKVTTPREVTNALREQEPGEVVVTIMRERQQQELTVTVEETQRRGIGQLVMPFRSPDSVTSY